MSIQGIESLGFTPFTPPVIDSPAVSATGSQGSGIEFSDLLIDGIERLQSVQTQADQLAVRAATGDLDAMHDYTIAATEASVTTSLTVGLRNRAVEAFTEIMRMQV